MLSHQWVHLYIQNILNCFANDHLFQHSGGTWSSCLTWEKNLTNHVAFSTLKILDCVFAGHLSCQSSDVNAVNQIQQFPL